MHLFGAFFALAVTLDFILYRKSISIFLLRYVKFIKYAGNFNSSWLNFKIEQCVRVSRLRLSDDCYSFGLLLFELICLCLFIPNVMFINNIYLIFLLNKSNFGYMCSYFSFLSFCLCECVCMYGCFLATRFIYPCQDSYNGYTDELVNM